MNTKLPIFILIGSILTMAVYSSSTNFTLAASECFGEGLDHFLCIGTTTLSNGEVSTWVYECVKDKDGHWDCHSITKANVIPPGLKNEIDATVRGEEQSHPNDSNDLGDLKNDNLQTQDRKAGEVPRQFLFPNKTILAP